MEEVQGATQSGCLSQAIAGQLRKWAALTLLSGPFLSLAPTEEVLARGMRALLFTVYGERFERLRKLLVINPDLVDLMLGASFHCDP